MNNQNDTSSTISKDSKKSYVLRNLILLFVVMLIVLALTFFEVNTTISSGVIIVLFILLGFLFVKNTTKKTVDVQQVTVTNQLEDDIAALAKAANKVRKSGGKLPVASENAIGKLAVAFNQILSMVGEFVKDIDNMSEDAFHASRHLEEIVSKTSSVIGEISSTLEELTASTMDLNSSIEDIANGAKEVDHLSKTGLEQLTDMDQKMEKILRDSNQASESVQELNVAAGQMESIIQVMSGIANQTNLLALNASIEAARAGDAGKGFAVVADEVGKLAGNTKHSLEEISKLIKDFMASAKGIVDIIQANNEEIDAGSGILKETTKTFHIIADNITKIVTEIDKSSDAASHIACGSQEIASSAQIQTAAVIEIADLSKALSEMSLNLKDTLSETHIGRNIIEIDLNEFDKAYSNISESQKTTLKNELNLNDKFVIGMIARLEPNKGHEFFINALKEVLRKHKNAACIIIGDGSLDAELKRKVKEAKLDSQINFLGYRKDSQALLSIMDLVVSTSIKEAMPPRILMEGMAAAKAIVSTDVKGAKALLTQSEDALLVTHNNVDQLVGAMNKMIEKIGVAKEMGNRGRRHIEELFALQQN